MIRWKRTAYPVTMTRRNAKYLRRAVRLVRVSPAAKRKPTWLDEYFMATYVSAPLHVPPHLKNLCHPQAIRPLPEYHADVSRQRADRQRVAEVLDRRNQLCAHLH